MNRKVLLIGAALILPVLLVLGSNLGRDPKKVRTPVLGTAAPTFDLRTAGKMERIQLTALKGSPVVVNFWATWCVPCYAEHPLMVNAARANPDVRFIGIVYDDREDKIIQFLKEYGEAYPTLIDDAGKTAIAYGVYGVPETFFLDRNGKIVAKIEGAADEVTLVENIATARGRS